MMALSGVVSSCLSVQERIVAPSGWTIACVAPESAAAAISRLGGGCCPARRDVTLSLAAVRLSWHGVLTSLPLACAFSQPWFDNVFPMTPKLMSVGFRICTTGYEPCAKTELLTINSVQFI